MEVALSLVSLEGPYHGETSRHLARSRLVDSSALERRSRGAATLVFLDGVGGFRSTFSSISSKRKDVACLCQIHPTPVLLPNAF